MAKCKPRGMRESGMATIAKSNGVIALISGIMAAETTTPICEFKEGLAMAGRENPTLRMGIGLMALIAAHSRILTKQIGAMTLDAFFWILFVFSGVLRC